MITEHAVHLAANLEALHKGQPVVTKDPPKVPPDFHASIPRKKRGGK